MPTHGLITELWFDDQALEAATFYTNLFSDSRLGPIHHYTAENPSGKPIGSILTVDFTIMSQRFQALNGGPHFKLSEAISFVIECEDQAEVDYYWDQLSKDPDSEACGWCKDQFGVSWQIVPKGLEELMYPDDPIKAKEAMERLLDMKKIIIADFYK
jgi:predicted 3-demethylubiquinone-9 3-methyltransferase (glyoxalase superfamily)